jgi:hypothetical protein
MEPEGSLSCSQEPATDPYPESDESNPHPPTICPTDLHNMPLQSIHSNDSKCPKFGKINVTDAQIREVGRWGRHCP